jgi:hypothetical protein
MPTYIRSTDFALSSYCESRSKDILCGILVSVVLYLTTWASPVAHTERQALDDVSTSGACLTTGIEAIDLDQLSTVPHTFVRKESQEHAPSGVRDYSGEAVVAYHSSDVQILDYDHLIFANESSGNLVPP